MPKLRQKLIKLKKNRHKLKQWPLNKRKANRYSQAQAEQAQATVTQQPQPQGGTGNYALRPMVMNMSTDWS